MNGNGLFIVVVAAIELFVLGALWLWGNKIRLRVSLIRITAAAGLALLLTTLLAAGIGVAGDLEASSPPGPGQSSEPSPDIAPSVTATVRFEQSVYQAAPGGQVRADLWVESGEAVGAWEVLLSFDDNLASLVAVTAGDFLSSTGRTTELLGPGAGSSPGQHYVGGYSYGTSSGVDGAGVLAQLTFEVAAQATGLVDLNLNNLLLVSVNGVQVTEQPVLGQGAQISITAGSSVGDYVFYDTSITNGQPDPGESVGVNDVTVVLTDLVRDIVYTQQTAGNGDYLFTNLVASDYAIAVVPPPALLLTSVSPQTFTLAAGSDDLGRDFGFVPTTGLQVLAFQATASATHVDLTWEASISGPAAPLFHVWRARADGEWQRLTSALLAPQATGSQTATFSYTDGSVEPGQRYRYRLEGASGEIFGPWPVRMPWGRLYLPMIIR